MFWVPVWIWIYKLIDSTTVVWFQLQCINSLLLLASYQHHLSLDPGLASTPPVLDGLTNSESHWNGGYYATLRAAPECWLCPGAQGGRYRKIKQQSEKKLHIHEGGARDLQLTENCWYMSSKSQMTEGEYKSNFTLTINRKYIADMCHLYWHRRQSKCHC